MAESKHETFGSSYPPPADSAVLEHYPTKRPSDPGLIPVYEQGQLKLFRLLFQNMPDGVVGTDVHGLITEANQAALEIFGRKAEELEGRPVFQHLEDEFGTPIDEIIGREIMRGRAIKARHVYVRRPDGVRRSCTLNAFPLVENGNILRAVGIFRDRTELEELMQIDEKTKLLNHRTFLQRVQEQILMARRKDKPLALVYLDLRKFKELNDQFGHEEGDRIIKMVARRLDEAVFRTDFKARSNNAGDEFTVLLTEIDLENVHKAVAKIAAATSFETELLDEHGRLETVSVSADIGICWRKGEHIPDAKAFIALADRAMYTCKKRVKAGEKLDHCLDKNGY